MCVCLCVFSQPLGQHKVTAGDIVLQGDMVGLVVACCLEDGTLMAIVEAMDKVGEPSKHSGLWRPAGRHAIWAASSLEQAVAWYQTDDGALVVIRI